jgi:predicted DNA-binding WGR domain protein
MAPDADNPTLLQVLVLERVDRAKNMARFYVLSIEPTLFEDLALVRRWGRIGSAGRERINLHPSRRVAQIELKKWLDRKRRRGYQLRPDGGRLVKKTVERILSADIGRFRCEAGHVSVPLGARRAPIQARRPDGLKLDACATGSLG